MFVWGLPSLCVLSTFLMSTAVTQQQCIGSDRGRSPARLEPR
jgi:hypothetical protein